MTIELRFHFQRDAFVLDAELALEGRGVTALFGPSGCGKTTLLRLIAGLDHCPEGFLRVNQQIWQQGRTSLPTHQRGVAYVFQEASLFDHLKVRANLDYGRTRSRRSTPAPGFDEICNLLGAETLLDRWPAELSGGQRQRIAIAQALLSGPQLLLLDEPLAALDLSSRAEILPLLERLHEELATPIVYVSHSPDEVARLADHLVLMEKGKILASGPINEMLVRADLPLSHDPEAAALIDAEVTGHDDEFHLTYLRFPGGQLTISRNPLQIGTHARLRVHSRDVSLTLQHQQGTSILNVFAARVEEITVDNPSQATIRLDIDGCRLLSRVTRKSVHQLGLVPGSRVFAQVKSVALL